MNTLKEVLQPYDNPVKKKFYYFDISADIKNLPRQESESKEALSEILAMAFQDNTGKDHWGSYFGPMTTWRRKDNGEEVLQPDRSYIKSEDITYWEQRAQETRNPLMKMRYAGLVYDFKKYVTNQEPSYKDIKLPYLTSVIEVVEGEYPVHDIECYYYIDRALTVASKLGNKELFERAQDVLWNIDQKYGKDESPGLWGRHFELMIRFLSKYENYEAKILKQNIDRFDRIEALAISEGGKTDRYGHILSESADLLCEYYQKKNDTAKIEEYLNRLLNVIRKSFDLRGGMWAQSMLQIMQAKYRTYHLYKNANRLYVEIQDLGQKALSEMTGQEFSIPIDNNQLKAYLDDFLSGSPREVFVRYIVRNIPNMQVERQRQSEEAQQSPLLDIVRTTTYDASGNPLNHIGVGANAENQKLMNGMYRRMLITAVFLRIEIEKMIEKDILCVEALKEAFKDSMLISESQKSIVEEAFKAYFDGNYLVACHLLIPQFEASIRRMASLCGAPVMRESMDGSNSNEYKSLEGLLDSEEVKSGLGEDVYNYFRNIFTDQNGWNLRNRISHGLIPASEFNNTMADRVVHAFSVLSQIRFVEKH